MEPSASSCGLGHGPPAGTPRRQAISELPIASGDVLAVVRSEILGELCALGGDDALAACAWVLAQDAGVEAEEVHRRALRHVASALKPMLEPRLSAAVGRLRAVAGG